VWPFSQLSEVQAQESHFEPEKALYITLAWRGEPVEENITGGNGPFLWTRGGALPFEIPTRYNVDFN
jgi:hypothetical protein